MPGKGGGPLPAGPAAGGAGAGFLGADPGGGGGGSIFGGEGGGFMQDALTRGNGISPEQMAGIQQLIQALGGFGQMYAGGR